MLDFMGRKKKTVRFRRDLLKVVGIILNLIRVQTFRHACLITFHLNRISKISIGSPLIFFVLSQSKLIRYFLYSSKLDRQYRMSMNGHLFCIISIDFNIINLFFLNSNYYVSCWNFYLDDVINTTIDPITACEALRQQNDALKQELHDIRKVSRVTLFFSPFHRYIYIYSYDLIQRNFHFT